MEFIKVDLSQDAKAFRAHGGQMLVEVEYDTWAYSPTGASYRRLVVVAHETSDSKGVRRELRSYQDPHGARAGRLFTSGSSVGEYDEVELDGVSLSKVVAPREITLIPLPPMRSPLHLFRRPSTGQLIYLSTEHSDRYTSRDDRSLKLFIGSGTDLHEVPINLPLPEIDAWFSRYPTANGTLDVPYGNRFEIKHRRKMPSWEGEQLEELMLERFLIVETETEVRLALNPGHSSWEITNTDLVTDDTAWDRLTAETQAQRIGEPLLAALRDPAKRASASVDFGPSVDVEHAARLLCPEHADHPARIAGSLVAVIDSILGVGRLGRRVLVPLPEDPRAAVILERLPYAEVSSWEVRMRNGEPAVDVICRLTAPPGVQGARMTFTIAHATALDGRAKNLEYAISGIEEEDARQPQDG